jgi:hypothetical protein
VDFSLLAPLVKVRKTLALPLMPRQVSPLGALKILMKLLYKLFKMVLIWVDMP